MSAQNEFSGPVYEVCEAVIIRDAVSLFINKVAIEHKDHSGVDYVAAMTLLSHVYKKFARIASTPVQMDENGRFMIRRDIRNNFDLN